MRRCISLILLAALVGTAAGCDSAPAAVPTIWAGLAHDARFACSNRPLDGDTATAIANGVRMQMDRTEFSCRFDGSGTCVLWVSAVNGRHEYWITSSGDDRVRMIRAIGDAVGWDRSLIEALAVRGDRGGSLGAADWFVGFDGALIVSVDEPARVS